MRSSWLASATNVRSRSNAVQAFEHAVQRRPEPADLVVGGGDGQPRPRVGGLDRRRPAAHAVHRTQGGGHRRVARHGGQQERDRPTDEQEAAEVAQRLLAILQRSADDDDEPAILRSHRRGQHPDRIVLTGDRLTIDDDGLANLVRELLALEQRTPAHGRCGVDYVSGRLDDLREALPLLGEGAAPRFLQPAVGLLDERGHVAGA